MSDLNRVIQVGRLVRTPEMKYTQSGTGVANFSIASNRAYKKNGELTEETSFFDCIAWDKLGETIVKHFDKGSKIVIEGRLAQRSWTDQNDNKRSRIEIVVEKFNFADSKQSASDKVNKEFSGQNSIENNPFSDDDIPF